jgi:hypothetical protein
MTRVLTDMTESNLERLINEVDYILSVSKRPRPKRNARDLSPFRQQLASHLHRIDVHVPSFKVNVFQGMFLQLNVLYRQPLKLDQSRRGGKLRVQLP